MVNLALNAKLELDPGTGSYSIVDDCTTISVPEFSVGVVDTSHLNLLTPHRTFTPGLIDNGSVTFECHFTEATYSQLLAVLGKKKITTVIPPTGANVNWRITAMDEDAAGALTPVTWTFNGFLNKLGTSFDEAEAIVKIKGEIKCDNLVTVA